MTIRQAYEAIARDDLRKHDIQLTEASMTFDEWWDESGAVDYSAGALKKFVRTAWIAATAAEHERCARVAEGVERPDEPDWNKQSLYSMVRRQVAAAIRRTP